MERRPVWRESAGEAEEERTGVAALPKAAAPGFGGVAARSGPCGVAWPPTPAAPLGGAGLREAPACAGPCVGWLPGSVERDIELLGGRSEGPAAAGEGKSGPGGGRGGPNHGGIAGGPIGPGRGAPTPGGPGLHPTGTAPHGCTPGGPSTDRTCWVCNIWVCRRVDSSTTEVCVAVCAARAAWARVSECRIQPDM